MNVDLIAKLKTEKEFFEVYREGDEKESYNGKSLLYYAISNHNSDARYTIADFLLDKNTDVKSIDEEHNTMLHVLLSRPNHDLPKTIELCKRLIRLGVDINALDKKNRSALQYIINMGYTDEELMPLYQLWFSQPCTCCETKNAWGFSPLDLAQKGSGREQLVELMKKHIESLRQKM